MRKILSVLLIFTIVFGAFSGCGKSSVYKSKSRTAEEMTMPATEAETVVTLNEILKISNEETAKMSNYMNAGEFIYSGSWIYGIAFADHMATLSKIKEDQTEDLMLSKSYSSFLNVVSGWIYYCVHNDSNKIISINKIRVSGADETVIVKTEGNYEIGSMIIYHDKIYYCENDISGEKHIGRLCCCDLDGKNKKTIMDKVLYAPYIINDYILYQDDNDGEKLHICNIDGSDDKVLIDRHVYYYVIYGSDIYYQSADEKFFDEKGNKSDNFVAHLRKCSLDGSNDSEFLGITDCISFAIANDKLYYTDGNDKYRLYCYDFKSESLNLISQDEEVVYILSLYPDSKIVYYDMIKEDELYYVEHIYFCKADGTGKKEMMKEY